LPIEDWPLLSIAGDPSAHRQSTIINRQ